MTFHQHRDRLVRLQPMDRDELCTWISIYAFSREGPSASTRIYYESAHPVGEGAVSRMDVISMYIPDVPLALAYFPQDGLGVMDLLRSKLHLMSEGTLPLSKFGS